MCPDPAEAATNGSVTSPAPTWTRSSFCATNACVEVAHTDRAVLLRDSKNPDRAPFVFTATEWSAFVAGIRAGEFTGK